MRILLASPKGPLYRRSGIFKKSLRYMPLTLPTLAALIPAELNVELECVDEGWTDLDPELVEADLVGLTVITGSAPRAYELASALRRRGITVVLGGPHVTLVPDDAAPHADAIVVGYAEETWPRLLRDFAAGTLQRRYLQSPDLSLAGCPLPDRTVLPRRHYLTKDVFEATRGCVHACEFCVVPSAWGRRPLQKPVAEVVADLRAEGARKAIFIDLNLIADRRYAAELFTALVPLQLQWYGLATTMVVRDPELLDLIARSGCRGLLLGFESILPSNLDGARKGFNKPDDYATVVEELHRRKIAVQGCFVFGMDDDTEEVCAQTANIAIEIGVDLPRFAIATPFPGTELYHRLAAQGRILTYDWSRYDGQHVVFQPAKMSPRELELATEAAWRRAYSWGGIARRLRRSVAPWPVAIGTNLGYRFYAHNLHRFYTCDWALAADPLHHFGPTPRTDPVVREVV